MQPSLTLPLQFEAEQRPLAPLPAASSMAFALTLDNRAWLSLLAEGWLPVRKEGSGTRLGIGKPVVSEYPDSRIEITAWLDPSKLPPSAKVLVKRKGYWVNPLLSTLSSKDQQFIWPGPLPLFAITHFCVDSEEKKERLLSMAQGFANVAIPPQQITIEAVPNKFSIKDLQGYEPKHPLCPPEHWNALRGAASTAIWAVPSIDPWLDLLCASFSDKYDASLAEDLNAPWLAILPWRSSNNSQQQTEPFALWKSMLSVFLKTNIRESWRPTDLLEAICDQARSFGIAPESLDNLLLETAAIIEDREMINFSRAHVDPLGFILQLILLRPKPEQFVTWRKDIPSLPPAIWWTGAILSGLIIGYRNLDLRFRGTESTSKFSDLRTWKLATAPNHKYISWPDSLSSEIDWITNDSVVHLKSGTVTWGERPVGRRGKWYAADYSREEVLQQASIIAKSSYPEAITNQLIINQSTIDYSGSGNIAIAPTKNKIIVTGEILIDLPEHFQQVQKLSIQRFKKWLATGVIATKLPELPTQSKPNKAIHTDAPIGLTIVYDFINETEENKLVKEVDKGIWLDDLRRRVQHYGWKYDYKSRTISESSYLGPLPQWALELASRLLNQGLLDEMPDQVIVNEYIGEQGISKHIDCPSCFRGPIVTISLRESWTMVFRLKKQKFETLLLRRSAVIMDGPARQQWTHEIPQRKFEDKQLRGRRLSLTFRKVNKSSN